LLPLKADAPDPDLDRYLRGLGRVIDDLVVVDGSDPAVFAENDARWAGHVRHLRPMWSTPMGKVGNVLTGLDAARHDLVVIADDDVRWTEQRLRDAVERMGAAAVARPQNMFVPAPWHARWDTGRILIHRAIDGDWPGTLLVRRSALPDGYAGDALFENLELVRTVRAGGGRERLLLDVVVPRRPPSTRKFLEQRVRQAYDEWARPGRLIAQLAVLPAVVRWRSRAAVPLASAAVVLASMGRWRAGGRRYWPASAALWAPAWVAERSLTSWGAVLLRARGGARFGGQRLPLAAHSTRALRRRVAVARERLEGPG
jgi:glycosyltransferase involved in cell wall biosynthesis